MNELVNQQGYPLNPWYPSTTSAYMQSGFIVSNAFRATSLMTGEPLSQGMTRPHGCPPPSKCPLHVKLLRRQFGSALVTA